MIVGSEKGEQIQEIRQGVESIWQFLERGEADLYVTYRFLAIRMVLFTEARNTDGKQVKEKMTISNLEMSS